MNHHDADLKVINEQQYDELKDLLEDDFEELIRNFLDDSQTRLSEIKQAYDQKENLSGYDAVHTLKGACANLGADALVSACYRMQMECRENRISESLPLIILIESELQKLTTEILSRLG